MRRREFIVLIGGAAVLRPVAVRAQRPGDLPTIAFLGVDDFTWTLRTSAFVQRLRELGWIDGRTVMLQYYWTQGRTERVVELAAEILPQKVDVIVTYGGAVATLKRATAVIPIVFAIANDPIGSGLIANLSQPGGNVTGLSLEVTEIAGKRLQLLHEVVPHLRRLAVLFDVGYSASELQMGEVQKAAHILGVEVEPTKISASGGYCAFLRGSEVSKSRRALRGGEFAYSSKWQADRRVCPQRSATNGLRCTRPGPSWWVDVLRSQISGPVSARRRNRRQNSTRRKARRYPS